MKSGQHSDEAGFKLSLADSNKSLENTLNLICLSSEDSVTMFHDIPELSKDSQGYVYWRGEHVEHYSFRHSELSQEKEAAEELARCCRHLEEIGVPVDNATAVWYHRWYDDMGTEHPYLNFAKYPTGIYTNADGLVLRRFYSVYLTWDGHHMQIYSPPQPDDGLTMYHALVASGWKMADLGQGPNNGVCYADTTQLTNFLSAHNFPAGEKYLQLVNQALGY